MSSFFTTPASQRKRKRTQTSSNSASKSKPRAQRTDDDDSISGSDISNDAGAEAFEDGSEDEEELVEDAASKRIRLAEQYLANTQKEALEEVGFDAADVDQENLRRRMGDRLKEDTAESRGRLYKYIADDIDWKSTTPIQFRADTRSLTGVAIAAGHVYTVTKDMTLIKWKLPEAGHLSRKPRKVKFTRGSKTSAEHHQAAILCVAASVDGRFVATGGADNRLIIWDAHTLKLLRIFTGQQRDNGHRDSVTGLAFRRDSNQLFSSSKDRTVKVWSCDELAYVETLFGHQDEVLDVDALGKEICVSAGARDRTARYWRVVEETQLVFRGGGSGRSRSKTHDVDSGVDVPAWETAGHEGSIDRIAFVDDDTFITGSDNGALALWNIHKKKAVFTLPLAHGAQPPPTLEQRSAETDLFDQYRDMELMGDLKPTPRWITALEVVPYSNIIISGSWDGNIRAFRITTDRRRLERIGTIGPEGRTNGVVNDLSVVENGDRGRDGLIIAAALGQEHRLGRWQKHEGKNAGYLFEVRRLAAMDPIEPDGDSADAGKDDLVVTTTLNGLSKGTVGALDNGFDGFD